MQFVKATQSSFKLRICFGGPTGAGKTYTALTFATALGSRVAVIDTERGSARRYAAQFPFDVLELAPPFHPKRYVEAIAAAEAAGYEVIVIDSLSHAWQGEGGLLEIVEDAAARMKTQNTFAAWREGTPIQQRFINGILQSRAHVVCTVRSKMEYALQDDAGKKTVVKLGLAPVQRGDIEFEFDVYAELDQKHNLLISKSRYAPLDQQVIRNPTGEVARELLAWSRGDGTPAPVVATPAWKLRIAELSTDTRLPEAWREKLKTTEWTETEAQRAIAGCEKQLKG